MSKWHAVDAFDEALERSKGMLLPFRWGIWLRLTLIVLLIGGIGGSGGYGGGSSDTSSTGDTQGFGASNAFSSGAAAGLASNLMLMAAFIAFIIILALVLTYLSSVSTFVFVKSLSSGDVRLKEHYRGQAENGLKLFLIQILAAFVLIIFVAVLVLAGIVLYQSTQSDFMLVALIIAAVLILVPLIIAFSLLMWMITEFAVPLVYVRGGGILQAAGQVKAMISSAFWQWALFLTLRIVFGGLGSVIRLIISLPFALALAALYFAVGIGGAVSPGSALIAASLIVLFIVSLVADLIVTFVTLPISVFLRYYGLVFLGLADPTLNIFKAAGGKTQAASAEEKVRVY
jgi:hypothetical protein